MRRRRVGPRGRAKYTKASQDFQSFCAARDLPLASSDDIDRALDSYLVFLFAGNKQRVQVAREAFYGVRYWYDLHNFHLPLSHASLEGFRKEDPDSARDPCPFEVLVLACVEILRLGTAEAVLAVVALLFCFDAYARPGALCSLRGGSLIRAGAHGWALIFFPGDRPEVSKTNTQDDTVEIGAYGREWLRKVASSLATRRQAAASLFGLRLPQLQKFLAFGLAEARLSQFKVTPHCLRHGGASADAAAGSPAPEVQFRGQWRDMRSVQRYMKKGALLRQLAKLTAVQKHAAAEALELLKRRLSSEILRRVPIASKAPVSPPPSSLRSLPAMNLSKKRRQDGPIAWSPKSKTHPAVNR